MATVFDLINGSYVTIFNRAADPQGALFWSQNLGFSSIGAASGRFGYYRASQSVRRKFLCGGVYGFQHPVSDDSFR